MTVRKQILVTLLATVALPLAASAATPGDWYAPLSARRSVETGNAVGPVADDSGAPTSYALLSHAQLKRDAIEQTQTSSSAADDTGPTDYALLSAYPAAHDRA